MKIEIHPLESAGQVLEHQLESGSVNIIVRDGERCHEILVGSGVVTTTTRPTREEPCEESPV
jgi:hypothetical protein